MWSGYSIQNIGDDVVIVTKTWDFHPPLPRLRRQLGRSENCAQWRSSMSPQRTRWTGNSCCETEQMKPFSLPSCKLWFYRRLSANTSISTSVDVPRWWWWTFESDLGRTLSLWRWRVVGRKDLQFCKGIQIPNCFFPVLNIIYAKERITITKIQSIVSTSWNSLSKFFIVLVN